MNERSRSSKPGRRERDSEVSWVGPQAGQIWLKQMSNTIALNDLQGVSGIVISRSEESDKIGRGSSIAEIKEHLGDSIILF